MGNFDKELTLTTLKYLLYKPWRPKGFFSFWNHHNVLVNYFRFIWTGAYLRYGSTAIINILLFQCGSRILTSDVIIWRIKSVPTLKVLSNAVLFAENVNYSRMLVWNDWEVIIPSRQKSSNQCCLNVFATSTTLGQHYTNIDLVFAGYLY